MEKDCPHILIVDDEPVLLEILQENLEGDGYATTSACTGEEAWELISADPRRFDAIVLDRLMPDMDGIEVLKRIKARPELKHVPVIMQTSLISDDEITEGLQAGAYYYLTKPFSAEALLAIVGHAAAEYHNYLFLQESLRGTSDSMHLLQQASFQLRTLTEARTLATLVAHVAPDPERVVFGLSELLLNAIEHGNLGISYQEKSELLLSECFDAEIERRLAQPEYLHRYARLIIQRHTSFIDFIIEDDGQGFDWQNYLEFSPKRAFDMHGRGIAIAKTLSFDNVEYRGNGNVVVATIWLTPPAQAV